jgi:hypothetical protein
MLYSSSPALVTVTCVSWWHYYWFNDEDVVNCDLMLFDLIRTVIFVMDMCPFNLLFLLLFCCCCFNRCLSNCMFFCFNSFFFLCFWHPWRSIIVFVVCFWCWFLLLFCICYHPWRLYGGGCSCALFRNRHYCISFLFRVLHSCFFYSFRVSFAAW